MEIPIGMKSLATGLKLKKNPIIYTNSATFVLCIHWMNIPDRIDKNNATITFLEELMDSRS